MRRIKFNVIAAIAAGTLAVSATTFTISARADMALDTSALARIPGAKETFASPATTLYTSPDTVAATAATVATLLAGDGWQPYSNPFGSKAENPNMEMISLKKGKQGLSVFVTVAPAQNNVTSVSYTAVPLVDDLPFLSDAAEIKYAPERPYLSLATQTELGVALAIYRAELTSRGWMPWSRTNNRKATAEEDTSEPNDNGRFAFFVRDGRRPLMLMIREREDGRRDVTIETVPEKLLTLAKDDKPKADTETTSAQKAAAAEAAREANDAFDALAGQIMKDVQRATKQALADIADPKVQALITPANGSALETNVAAPSEPRSAPAPVKAVELRAEDQSGLPVPAPNTLNGTEKTPFRVSVHASVDAPLDTVLAFYRKELSALGWKELDGATANTERATAAFTSPDGPATLTIERKSDETFSTLVLRREGAARESRLLPKKGRATLMFGNVLEKTAELTVGRKKVKIAAGRGTTKTDGPTLDVAPGKHTYTLRMPGLPPVSEEIDVAEGDIWGLMVGPGGVLALPMY